MTVPRMGRGWMVAFMVPLVTAHGEGGTARNSERPGVEGIQQKRCQIPAHRHEPEAPPPGSGSGLAPSLVATQGASGSSGLRFEVFGRGALALLRVSAVDSFAIAVGPETFEESADAARLLFEGSWGGGVRLMSGNWGVEGAYARLDSFALSPSWLVADDSGVATVSGLFGPFTASRADMLVGQVVRTFQRSAGWEVSLGVGAGWMRAADPSADGLSVGLPLPVAAVATFGEPPPGLSPDDLAAALAPEVEFAADRTSITYAGSLGLTFRVGPISLRPRVDVIVARALTTDTALSFPGLAVLDLPGAEEAAGMEFHSTTSVTPRIFLLSLDIGFSN